MSNKNSNKNSLIDQIGGPSQFEFVIIKYCENIQDDPRVSSFFAHLDLYALIDLQQEFVTAALNKEGMAALATKYSNLGLNERHFDMLKAHFIEALRDSWVPEKLVAVLDQHYETLRPLYKTDSLSNSGKETSGRIHIVSSMSQRKTNSFHSRLGGMNGNPRT